MYSFPFADEDDRKNEKIPKEPYQQKYDEETTNTLQNVEHYETSMNEQIPAYDSYKEVDEEEEKKQKQEHNERVRRESLDQLRKEEFEIRGLLDLNLSEDQDKECLWKESTHKLPTSHKNRSNARPPDSIFHNKQFWLNADSNESAAMSSSSSHLKSKTQRRHQEHDDSFVSGDDSISSLESFWKNLKTETPLHSNNSFRIKDKNIIEAYKYSDSGASSKKQQDGCKSDDTDTTVKTMNPSLFERLSAVTNRLAEEETDKHMTTTSIPMLKRDKVIDVTANTNTITMASSLVENNRNDMDKKMYKRASLNALLFPHNKKKSNNYLFDGKMISLWSKQLSSMISDSLADEELELQPPSTSMVTTTADVAAAEEATARMKQQELVIEPI